MQRAGWVFLLLLFASTLRAFVVEVPGSFIISGVERLEGKVVLPAERTYQNIRILDKATYDFVSSCTMPCVQSVGDIVPVVVDARPAAMRAGMWIVQVSFNRAWLITFLVFEKGNEVSIKPPQGFKFLNVRLALQTHEVILEAVRQKSV